jgi:hypothetical protein
MQTSSILSQMIMMGWTTFQLFPLENSLHLPFPLLTLLQATSPLLPFLDPPSILIVDLLQVNVV